MPDLKGFENVQLVIAFIVPGLIIAYVRARFVNGRMDKFSEAILSYLSLTAGFRTQPLRNHVNAIPRTCIDRLARYNFQPRCRDHGNEGVDAKLVRCGIADGLPIHSM